MSKKQPTKEVSSEFNDKLNKNIYINLKRDNLKFKETDTHINGLKCPVCGKNEGFAHRDSPMAIMCHRNNECGATTSIKSVYPELWQDLATQYPPTPKDKKATARAYLESRGLNTDSIAFEQSTYTDNGKKYQTVKFSFFGIVQYRLIDYTGKDKNRYDKGAKLSGKVFETIQNNDDAECFITEGIIDALSWQQAGKNAIATLASGNCPREYYEKNTDKTYILAFDNDKAGHSAIANHCALFAELSIKHRVFLPPHGKDINDLLIDGSLNSDKLDDTIQTGLWRGKLHTANSSLDYFEIYRERYSKIHSLVFEFKDETFKGYLKEVKEDFVPKIKLLADCSIRLLHSVIDDSQTDKQQMEHYLETYSKREGKGHIRLDASELVKLDAFKSALQNHRQLFYGNSNDLNDLASYLFKYKPPKIRALSVIGYDDKSKGFYFPKFMYDENGKRIDANGDKYFTDANIKPFMDCSDTVTNRLETIDLKRFITLLFTAYSNKGLLALGFYVSSLFSHIVFDYYNFFPFLSLYGDPHAGKSFVSRLLNACLFIHNEGQAMTTSNTVKGELRKISQKSSLVCALLEGRNDKSRFDYDSILPLYNRNALYTRATTSQDNRTHDLPLKAALSFVWNHECFTLKPAKERVISLHFADSDNNETTGAAWIELNSFSPEQLASVGHYLLTNRKLFESELIDWIKNYAEILKTKGVHVTRIAENHAIALAGIAALIQFLNITNNEVNLNDLVAYTIERAKHKLENAKTESHIADYFFQSIEGLDTYTGVATNSDNQLVIHLPTVLAHLQDKKNGFTNKSELITSLKGHDRFIEVKSTRCFIKTCDAYHFKL